jgi:hypothetical protein
MPQRSNYIGNQSWIKAAIQCFLAITLFLVASTGYARQAFKQAQLKKTTVQSDLPAGSKPALPAPEIPEENEAEEEPGIDGDGEFLSTPAVVKKRDASELLRLQSIRSLQNRHTVSLFILYHAWKSFLS